MDNDGNMNKAPENSMAESSGGIHDYSLLDKNEVTKEQIEELVRNLRPLMRDPSVNSIVRFLEYMKRWFDEYINLECYDKEGAFFYGFRVGGECVQALYSNHGAKSNTKGRKGTE